MGLMDTLVIGGQTGVVSLPYATCSTAAATVAKTCSFTSFTLATGAHITVKFTYANTASSPTLNVNSTGAKTIRWRGATLISSQYWAADQVVDFVYDGTYWNVIGANKDNNTTYSLSSFGITATATELNYTDGVTSNIQTQLDGKASSSHTHSYLPLSAGASYPLTGSLNFKTDTYTGNIVCRNASGQLRAELFSGSGTGAVAAYYIRVFSDTAGSTYSNFIFGTDGTLTANAFNGNASSASLLKVQDVRDATRYPNYFTNQTITGWFNQSSVPLNGYWFSGIHIKGWSSTYYSWELASGSGDLNQGDNLYLRRGAGSSWSAWRTILDSNNWSDFIDISSAGSSGMVREFNSGLLGNGSQSYTTSSSASKIYAVSWWTGDSDTPLWHTFVFDYKTLQAVGTGSFVRQAAQLSTQYTAVVQGQYNANGTITFSANYGGCINHVCGYY